MLYNFEFYKKSKLFRVIVYFALTVMFILSFFLFYIFLIDCFNLQYRLFDIFDFIPNFIISIFGFLILTPVTLVICTLPILTAVAYFFLFISFIKRNGKKKRIAEILIAALICMVFFFTYKYILIHYLLLVLIMLLFPEKNRVKIITALLIGIIILISAHFINGTAFDSVIMILILTAVTCFFIFTPEIKDTKRNVTISLIITMVPTLIVGVAFVNIIIEAFPSPGRGDFSHKLINEYTLSRSSAHEVRVYYDKYTAYSSRSSFPEIPPKIVEIGWDNKFIIAKQFASWRRKYPDNPKNTYVEPDGEIVHYWILDSEIHELYGPYNEREFKIQRNKLKVPPSLKLKEVKQPKKPKEPVNYYLLIVRIYIILLPFIILMVLVMHKKFYNEFETS